MDEKYCLFGAGINAHAIIQFFGKQNIDAAIDNDVTKQGTSIEGIPIISLEEYVEKNKKEPIIITGIYDSNSIIEELNKKGIFNYYISPYMQNGFYRNAHDIVEKLELYKYSNIIFCTLNPISERIAYELMKEDFKTSICYMDRDNLEEIGEDVPVIITNSQDKQILQRFCNIKQLKAIVDINVIFKQKYGFLNEKITAFKNVHKGKRCFIVGNGPSLRYEDLEQLQRHNEICFGVNRIYLAYSNTTWRPTYYVAVDYRILQKDSAKILEMEGTKFIRHTYSFAEKWNKNDIYEFRGLDYPPGNPQISFDMYEGIYIGNTVIYDAIQIALYMGFQEIYLIGVDMTSGVRVEDEGFHFYKSPDTKENLGINRSSFAKRTLGYAAEEIEKSGKKLRNATRGGELNEVTRIDFDSLF